MSGTAPDGLWDALVASGLADAARVQALRREFEGLPFPPGTAPTAAAEVAARWLVNRGTVTAWQAKRLLRGETGPFFVGEYRLLDRIDCPAPNAFRARHDTTGREVAIVVLATKRCVPEVWADIVQRTKAAHAAADPVLVRPRALEKADKLRFIVCDEVGGAPLAAELATRGALAPEEASAVVLAVARGVAWLHRLGCVHGGISLDAVYREPSPVGAAAHAGPVRLLQFPLAGDPHVVPPRVDARSAEAIAGLGGRASFVAPEIARGAPATTRSDVYALGCLLHALLTGVLPCWQGDAARTLAHAVATGPAALGAAVPVELATLVGYMTARDPLARYPTAVEAADAIAASLGQAPVAPQLPEQRPFFAGGGPEIPAADAGADAGHDGSAAAALPIVVSPARVVSIPARRPQRRKTDRNLLLAIGGLGFLLATVATVAGVFWLRPGAAKREGVVAKAKPGDEPVRDGPAAQPGEDAAPAPDIASSPAAGANAVQEPLDAAAVLPPRREAAIVLADTPGLPWAPPAPPGPPPALAHLPPGAQVVVLARPAALLATDEGKLFVRALGAEVERALATAARLAGCSPEQIELVQVGWRAADEGLELGAVVWGSAALPVAGDAAARTAAWGQREPVERSGETVYPGSPVACWVPRRHGGRALVVGSATLVDELVAAEAARVADEPGGIEASLPRDLETLVGTLDGGRHVTLFGSPAWLESDGSALVSGPLARLGGALAELFAGGIRAAALGLHFGDTSYAELDVVAPADVPSARLAATLATRIAALPSTAEASCNALDPHPFGRRLVMRLPRMLEVLAENVRAGGEGQVAVVNCHLPPHAAHNLALAAELALAQTPGSGAAPAANARAAPPPAGIRDRLAKRISLSFPRDTLERSIQLLAEETGVPIEIRGSDLQLEGITKNQSFALDECEKAAEGILLVILARSNPDGKLVYVVRTRDGGESLEITTRAAAGKRGDPIPPVFDSPIPPGDSPK
ncbi:MAG: protein kinase domain-containing protein [Planctomycetota bacterium]